MARFDDSGQRLVTLGKRITLWNVARRERIAKGPSLAHAAQVDFSPDGKVIVAKNTLGDVLLVDAAHSTNGLGSGAAPTGRVRRSGSLSTAR